MTHSIKLIGFSIALCLDHWPSCRPGLRHTEGLVRGFLSVSTLDGAPIADGDLSQSAKGDQVTSRLVYRFRDGSLHDELAVYSQRGQFRLISSHLVQKGPSFPNPIDMTIKQNGDVTVRYDDDGQPKVATERLKLPADVANGMMLVVMKNLGALAAPHELSYVVATPKPQVVRLVVSPGGETPFSTGGLPRTAAHFVVKVEIGGLKGLIAPLVGKQPADSHVWILGGDVPAFVRSEQAFYAGGPIWRTELVSPRFAKTSNEKPGY